MGQATEYFAFEQVIDNQRAFSYEHSMGNHGLAVYCYKWLSIDGL